MASIEVGISSIQLKQLEDALNPKQLKQAIYQALKRTATTGATRIRKKVREVTYISASGAKDTINAGMIGDDGNIGIRQKLTPIQDFKVSVSKKAGVVALVSKGRPPIILRHAFRARMKSGHVGIFSRASTIQFSGLSQDSKLAFSAGMLHFKQSRLVTRNGNKKAVGRFPIVEQFGPSVLNIVEAPKIMEEVMQDLGDVLEKNVQSQIDRFTK